jgi:hypothetical protein
MKIYLTILLFFLSLHSTFAKCANGGFQFYPEQKEIGMNSMFIIQGYGASQKLIVEFEETKMFLISKNGELIELKLQELFKGKKGLTQAIFKPSKELEPNTKYYLKHPDNSIEYFTQWNSERKKREKVYWKTNDLKTFETLDSNLKIEFEKTKVIYYGCGPSVNAIFKTSTSSESEIWYKTEVYNMTDNSTEIYFIKDSNRILNVGHGMCGGAFDFDRTSKYKVRFTPMNIDGNKTTTTEWFEFENPYLTEK